MDLQLRGKRALVTGSTAGIGLATAIGLFREGASVVVDGRTPQRVQEAVRKIRGSGGDGSTADLSTDEAWEDHRINLGGRRSRPSGGLGSGDGQIQPPQESIDLSAI